jgi:CubicO group peptidase (beta-lactamase class C family)/pimeloyl-ACP methyl ester carboxylesterase
MKKLFLLHLVLLASFVHAQRTDTMKVKVHDHVMTLYSSGAGSPAVIMESGLGATHHAWDSVRAKVARYTKVIAYDRPGYLHSDSCSKPRDAINIAKELKEALAKAGIKPPYVLAGWSLGGAFVRVFAGLYPKEVAGLVLVDPAPEESYARFTKELPELMTEDEKYVKEILSSKTKIGEREEMRYFDSSMNQVRRSDAKHNTPTYLLIAAGKAPGGQDRDPSNLLNKIWIEELEKWAKKRPNLQYKVITNSGHHIARSQPDTVVHAIKKIVQQYQSQILSQSATPYKKPLQLNDGIQTATLKDVSIDENIIRAMTGSITNGNYPNIHSVLLIRNNKLVYEKYFPGNDVIRSDGKTSYGFTNHHHDSLHDLRSVTKSIIGASVLIAQAQGKIKNLNQRVFDFFPEYAQHDTGLKKQITVQHLLNMSAGLEWNENISYLDPKNSETQMSRSPDAIEYVLSQTLVDTPGKKFNYSGGCSQVLAAIVEKVSGMPVDQFLEQYLFNPLGIKSIWIRFRDGKPSAASGLRIRSRDMAKFGLLYLNNGNWNGKSIIPPQFVEQTLQSQVTTTYNSGQESYVGYSNQFWLPTYIVPDGKSYVVEAVGNGGQLILISKELNLVLIVTAGNYNIRNLPKDTYHIYRDFVYPAVSKPATSYKKPVQLNDGIQTATLTEVGIEKNIIHAMTDSITNVNYPNIHSVLILRNNKLVYEQYWQGNDVVRGVGFVGFVDHHRDSLHDIRSITKSVVSAAVLIAVDQGKIKSVNQRIFDYFPDYSNYDTGLKRQITIKHLLNMTAGLQWNEETFDTTHSEIRMNRSVDANDYVLRQSAVDTPGKNFLYNGGLTQLLAAIVERGTGIPIDKFTEQYLFKPLGIKKYTWVKVKDGSPSAAGGLRMRSRDLAKLGLLFLNEGKWGSKQLIPHYLLNEALQMHTKSVGNNGYGYQFWIWNDTVLTQPITTVQAQGNGGQRIAINKHFNLITVITAGNYDTLIHKKGSDYLYLNFVYPAVIKGTKTHEKPVLKKAQKYNVAQYLKLLTYQAITSEFKLDTAYISKLMDDDFISIYPHKTQNKQQELEGIYKSEINRRNDGHTIDSLVLDDFKIQLFDNTAVATYYSVTKGTKKGVPFDNNKMRWYDVWVKRNGEWKWISSQGTQIN